MSKDRKQVSIVESIAPGLTRHWQLDEVLFHGRTPYQEIVIGRGAQGLGLFCNGERQSTELSQRIYHEGQFMPAALVAGRLDDVLVIGSSEGVVSQMAISEGARQVIHVDIDGECVHLCAKYLPYGYSPADVERALAGDGPIKLFFRDGYEYVEGALATGQRFDVIVMDLPDEQVGHDEQQNRLYAQDFLVKIGQLLKPEGAFITQAGSTTYWRNSALKSAWRRMNAVFPTCVFYELDEQDWTFVVGSHLRCDNHIARMKGRLAELPEKPVFIDELSIERCTIPPISIRQDL